MHSPALPPSSSLFYGWCALTFPEPKAYAQLTEPPRHLLGALSFLFLLHGLWTANPTCGDYSNLWLEQGFEAYRNSVIVTSYIAHYTLSTGQRGGRAVSSVGTVLLTKKWHSTDHMIQTVLKSKVKKFNSNFFQKLFYTVIWNKSRN